MKSTLHLKAVAKFEHSTEQLYITCLRKCDLKSFIRGICLPEMLSSVSYVDTAITACVQNVGLSINACFESSTPLVNGCVSDAFLNAVILMLR